ncbi:hypothetical protein BKA64DRAFT_778922 [Cadophora sp. MPI-SDFR-AT-0126]|nr:hypothetical protein BKA64DRAFT_778922 [Leotiomycetes sp. MPI-SDFR-AT-0126]
MTSPTTTIDHIIYCGDPRLLVATKTFIFEKQVPELAPLVPTPNGLMPPAGAWVTSESIYESFGSNDSDEIAASHPWTCIICGKTSKAFCIVFANNLWDRNANKKGVDPTFKPSVVELRTPVCRHDRSCRSKVLDIAQSEDCVGRWREMDPKMVMNVAAGLCASCEKGGMKLYAGCKEIRYCSKKCQIKMWPAHKKDCKRAQKT